jgi:hypothetical protein
VRDLEGGIAVVAAVRKVVVSAAEAHQAAHTVVEEAAVVDVAATDAAPDSPARRS